VNEPPSDCTTGVIISLLKVERCCIRYDSSGWNVQSSTKVKEKKRKKDRQSGRH